jgi:antibiotic biosynthesis monooxygenase (ABM) superfamily enzyme
MVALQLEAAKFPGFRTSEIVVTAKEAGSNWRLVQRFATDADASRWRISEVRKTLIDELASTEKGTLFRISDEMSQNIKANVATSIVTALKPGKEKEFIAWQAKVQSEQAQFPGFAGSSIEPPAQGHSGLWASVLRFDTPDHMEAWFKSKERNALLGELDAIVNSTRISKVPTSFPGWFPHDELTGDSPQKWKTAALVLLGLFPVIMLEVIFLVPFINDFHTPVRSFITMIGSVAATTYFTMPLFIKLFGWWLLPGQHGTVQTEVAGLCLVLALYILEIATFWPFIP